MCFSGPTTTTTSTNTGSQYGTNTSSAQSAQTGQTQQTSQTQSQQTQSTMPTMPSWLSSFYEQIPQQYQSAIGAQSRLVNTPLYGPAQQANFENQVNTQTNQANKNIQSQLAATGALNSTRAAQEDTALQLGKIAQNANYAAQIPLLNAQFQQGALGQLGNLIGNAGNFRPPVIGSTSTGNTSSQAISNLLSQILSQSNQGGSAASTSSSGGTQTQQQSGGLLDSLMGGLLGAGLSMLTGGASSLFGGGGGGSSNTPFDTASLNQPQAPPSLYTPTSYGAQPMSSSQILGQIYGNPAGPNVGPYSSFTPMYPNWGG